jgi:hypothetical protein
MDRSLDSLSAEFRPLAFEVLARLVERGLAVMIVQTLRTLEEHQRNMANGTSRTALSKHLPRRLRGYDPDSPDADKADAIDLCPYAIYDLHGPDKLQWDASDPAWAVIGAVGESVGLQWGGRWRDPHDPGHLALVLHA